MPVTRRALAGTALAAATVTAFPVLSAVPALVAGGDEKLVSLGRRFDAAVAEANATAARTTDEDELTAAIDRADAVADEIVRLHASGLAGMRVKARVLRWSNGAQDFERWFENGTLDDRATLSLVRDLLSGEEGALAAETVTASPARAATQLRKLIADWYALDERRERLADRIDAGYAAVKEYRENCDAWQAELDRRGVFTLEQLDEHLADAQDRIEDQIIAFPVGDMDTARAKMAALPAMFDRETDEAPYYRLLPHVPALIASFSAPPLPASPRLVTETKAA